MSGVRPIATALYQFVACLLLECLAGCSTGDNRARPEDLWEDPKLIGVAQAIDRDDLGEIDKAIIAGADLNLKGKDDTTILIYAIAAKKSRAFEHLLTRGANPNVRINGIHSIIHLAAYSPITSEWLRILLKHGADPNFEGFERYTPIFSAVHGKIENLEMLLNSGADIEHKGDIDETPLLFAAGLNFYDKVHFLLTRGADFRAKNKFGRGLEFYVVTSTVDPSSEKFKWREKVIKLLIENGVDFTNAERQVANHSPSTLPKWHQEQHQRRHGTNINH
jgi:hypothetical protein